MRISKSGYTLAEMLVVLAIAAVVAAITIPGLVTKSTNSTLTNSRDRAINLLQTGIANIFDRASRNSIDGVGVETIAALKVKDVIGGSDATNLTSGFTLFDKFRSDLNILEVDSSSNYINSVKEESGDNTLSTIYSDAVFKAYSMKGNNIYLIVQSINDENVTSDIADDTVLTRIFIDANGSKGPNRLSKDIFEYGLGNNGHIHARGTHAFNNNIIVIEDK